MTRVMSGLVVMGMMTGTLASLLIWTLLTDPATIAAAVNQGGVRLLLAALVGAL